MSKQLLILPITYKDNISQDDQNVVNKILSEYDIFYVEENSYDVLKKYISENVFDLVVYAYSNLVRDYKFIRVIKSLNLKTKLILLYPQISNIKAFKSIEHNVYDPIYQLLSQSSSMEISNCQLSDVVIVSSDEDKEILKSELSKVVVETSKNVLSKGVSPKEKSKCMVSIVMLTYNQLEDTKICVESLFKHTTDVNYELIFVDNGSTKDDTKTYLETLKTTHSNIKVIYNDENLGFACANNQGIEISEGEYVLLLNNDVILTDGWLDRMLQVAESDKRTGLVAPATNHASGRQVVVFDATADEDEEIQKFAKTTLSKNAGCWISVKRVIGFCMLIKREVLFKVGVLDEMFGPGGYEDYDYCMRVKQEGYDIVVATDVFVFHIGGKGYSSNNMNYSNLRSKNIELLIDKWTRNSLEIMEKLPDGI
ncbi:MAG: glycosyltransferase family 2 protein [Endomicrobiaceae bacterium]|nr:glycosyltransferase family 2 protein [Endomicrobiaceae bacterium]MDD5102060.1 glycosyltransferase family 2 protein [Endomicrobiaceae bacterium]